MLRGKVEEHHLPLVLLLLHTQHGNCGAHVTLDGEPFAETIAPDAFRSEPIKRDANGAKIT